MTNPFNDEMRDAMFGLNGEIGKALDDHIASAKTRWPAAPDNRLRDDIATRVFVQALADTSALGTLVDADRQAMLEALACLSFEAAQAFVSTRKAIEEANQGPAPTAR